MIHSLAVTGILIKTFNQDFNNRNRYEVSEFDFILIPNLVITGILTATYNEDFNNRR
jgi:hypothetical protein